MLLVIGYKFARAKDYYENFEDIGREKIDRKKEVFVYDSKLNLLYISNIESLSNNWATPKDTLYSLVNNNSFTNGCFISYNKLDKNNTVIVTKLEDTKYAPNIVCREFVKSTKYGFQIRINGKNKTKLFDNLKDAIKYRNDYFLNLENDEYHRFVISKEDFHKKYIERFGLLINDY